MDLKDRFDKILIDNNINGAKLATILGVGKAGIYKILRGETKKLHPDTVDLITEKFPQYTKEWVRGAIPYERNANCESLTQEDIHFIRESIAIHEEQLRKDPVIAKWIKLIESEAKLEVYRKIEEKNNYK